MSEAQQKRKVLVIAYYFPPLGLSGVQRTLKFVKYLPSFGWEPTVLTVEERGYFAKDATFLGELSEMHINIIRTQSFDPWHILRNKGVVHLPSGASHNLLSKLSQFFLIPDNKIGWKKHAIRAARKLLAAEHFDAIYSTAPPYTDFLIAAELRREFGLPLVVDYRDAWLENPLHLYATPLHRLRHRQLERSVLRYSDHIITINRRIKETIIRNYPFLQHNDISIISQGFDAEDFQGIQTEQRKKFRITHSGTFYYNRTPRYFLKALQEFIRETPEAANNIEACFAGTWRDEDAKLVKKFGLEGVVNALGYRPHKECVALLQNSDALWMIIGNGKGEEMMSTGKLYEYLGAGKPILGCVPGGMAKQLLEKSGCAYISPPEDIQTIKNHLTTLYRQFKSGRLPRPAPEFVMQFERRALTEELARILSRVTHIGPPETRVVQSKDFG